MVEKRINVCYFVYLYSAKVKFEFGDRIVEEEGSSDVVLTKRTKKKKTRTSADL